MSCTCLLRGGRMTYSTRSLVRCLACGHFWRTAAKYVESLTDATHEESTQP